MKRIFSSILIFTLVISSGITVLAKEKKDIGSKKDKPAKVEQKSDVKTDDLQQKKIELKEEKSSDENKDLKQKEENLKNKLEKKEAIELKKSERKEMKSDLKELKEIAKRSYSQEDIEAIEAKLEELKEKYPGIKTIPVENIISKNVKMKFDTPPVIKDGRTLIPVRALTEAFGATVTWNEQDKQVVIVKDDIEMKINTEEKIAYVNGEEVELDVSAEIMNGRTIVPLRFVVEAMGLDINWDEETQTIEIEEEATETTEEVVQEPVTEETAATEEVAQEPVAEETVATEEVTQEAVTETPVAEEVVQEPVVETVSQ